MIAEAARNTHKEVGSEAALRGELADLRARLASLSEENEHLRRQAIARSHTSARERDAILGQIIDGVIVTDASGLIRFVNETARRLHGLAELDVPVEAYSTTYNLFTLDGQPYPPSELPLARAVQRNEVVVDAEWRIRRPDGTDIVAMGTAVPVRADDGRKLGAILTFRDVTASRALERSLRVSEERYRSLIDASAQIVWTNSPEGEMRDEQPGWSGLTGQECAQYQGYGWAEAVHPHDRAHTLTQWRKAVETGTVFLCDHRVLRHDGVYRDFTIRAVPVREADGSIREWVGVHTDVTDRKGAETERERLITALEATNCELDQFAFVVSHDLKAPLRGMANLSHWIEEDLSEVMNEEARGKLHLLHGRVRRLDGLIDGILSYSRAGRVRERVETVEVGKLLSELIELLAPPSSMKVEVPEGMPTVRTERVPLQQVFMNLIGNALKHTRRPDARVEIGVRDLDSHWEFSVKDNGPGIAPAHQERIWGIFQTLEARDKVEGTGIGLSVVKKLVDTRGGRAWVQSAVNEGAAFYFTWRKQAAE